MFFLKYLFLSFRPNHWIKNFFVFIPLIFVGLLFDKDSFLIVLTTFGIFCLAASAVYLLNDVLDREKDKQHPIKKDRPIAAGKVSVPIALVSSLVLASLSIYLASILNFNLVYFVLGYILLNILYSLYFKKIVIIDAFFVAFSYLFRIYAGAYVIKVPVSPWLFLIILLFALVVSFGKREEELSILREEARNHRQSLEYYSKDLLSQLIIITSTLTIISYILYTVSPETILKHGSNLVFTSPLVLFGFLRYLYLVHRKDLGSPIRAFLIDKTLFSTVIIWILMIVGLIYGKIGA